MAQDSDAETFVPGHDTSQRQASEVLALFNVPAYARRGRRVEEALEELLQRCRAQRDKWLLMPRTLLGKLRMLAGDWPALLPFCADEAQLCLLQGLHDELDPRPRFQVARTSVPRRLTAALRELIRSIIHFNERWSAYLAALDLTAINAARAEYNRWYLLEKECALRSPRLARLGFKELPPLDAAALLELLPPLPVPRAGAYI